VLNLLQPQGTNITTAHGELPIHLSPTLEIISHNRSRQCWTHLTTIGNTTQQNNNKGYITIFAVCDKGCTHWSCHKSHHRSTVAALRRYIARQGNHKQSTQTEVPTSKMQQTNFMKSTTCFNPQHRRQDYRTSWPLKDVTGDSSHHHMDTTSEDYEKQQ
jgi:hypothetical protein